MSTPVEGAVDSLPCVIDAGAGYSAIHVPPLVLPPAVIDVEDQMETEMMPQIGDQVLIVRSGRMVSKDCG